MVAKLKEDSYERGLHKAHAVLSNQLSPGARSLWRVLTDLQSARFQLAVGSEVTVGFALLVFRRISLSQKSLVSYEVYRIRSVTRWVVDSWLVIFLTSAGGDFSRRGLRGGKEFGQGLTLRAASEDRPEFGSIFFGHDGIQSGHSFIRITELPCFRLAIFLIHSRGWGSYVTNEWTEKFWNVMSSGLGRLGRG